MMWVNIVLILGCAGLGYWVWQRKPPKETIVVSIASEPAETAPAKPARKLTNIAEITSGAVETPAAATPQPIQWSDHPALIANDGKPVVIEGQIVEIGLSLQKDFLVLYFAKSTDANAARILIPIKDATEDLTLAALQPLQGKTIRVSGTMYVHKEPNVVRPNITISHRAAITFP